MLHLFALALLASLGDASLTPRNYHCHGVGCQFDYMKTVCAAPTNSRGKLDITSPCVIQGWIDVNCEWEAGFPPLDENTTYVQSPNGPQRKPDVQRLCLCESLFFDAYRGCGDCFVAHGQYPGNTKIDFVASLSSTYCAAAHTPTQNFIDFMFSYQSRPYWQAVGTSEAKHETTFSDPIGTDAPVSEYWTPAYPTSAYFNLSPFTQGKTPTTTAIKNGQIVATATTPAASTTSSGGSVARQTEVIFAGALGLVGFGVVAML